MTHIYIYIYIYIYTHIVQPRIRCLHRLKEGSEPAPPPVKEFQRGTYGQFS